MTRVGPFAPSLGRLKRRALIALQAALLVCTCSCGDGPEAESFTFFTLNPGCSSAEARDFVYRTTRESYLYAQDIPDEIRPDSFPDPEQLLDAMTSSARSAGRDRFFSVLTTVTADSGLFLQGQFLGFGLTFRRDTVNGRLFVVDVLEGSPAAALYPYVDVAVIGERTLGKPVGNLDFDMPGCDVRLKLVAFELLNSQRRGGYFSGLPDANYTDTFCPVPDDLSITPGDGRDPMTREALGWLTSSNCSAAATFEVQLLESRAFERRHGSLESGPATF